MSPLYELNQKDLTIGCSLALLSCVRIRYRPRTEYDGRLCFHRCLSGHARGGVPQSLVPGPFLGGGTPCPVPRTGQGNPLDTTGILPWTEQGMRMVMQWLVHLLHFHAGGLSCIMKCYDLLYNDCNLNKKVLLHDCKRHTACNISFPWRVLSRGRGPSCWRAMEVPVLGPDWGTPSPSPQPGTP